MYNQYGSDDRLSKCPVVVFGVRILYPVLFNVLLGAKNN